MATEWSVTARRAGQGFQRTPRKGPRSRVFVTGAARTLPPCFSHERRIRGGLTPVRPDEADSQLAFASSPWPDLPRAVQDRTPPAKPILSLTPQPERHLIRLPQGQEVSMGWEAIRRIGGGAQAATHRIPGACRVSRRNDAEPAPVLRPRPSPGQAPLSMSAHKVQQRPDSS